MSPLSRVVWSEGMHLAQHHFQAQNRYFEETIRAAVDHLFFSPYGCAAVALDEEALVNGTAVVTHARGIMPDGTPFNFPDEDPLPSPIEVASRFGPTDQRKRLALAIPALRPGTGNCAEADAPSNEWRRYRSVTLTATDETSGGDARPISTAEKNFRLVIDPEADDSIVSMPIAQIRRDSTGKFIVDPAYIPPCVRLGASKPLMQALERLIERLESKAESLTSDRPDGSLAIAQYSSREIGSFWLAHAIHQALGPLRHQLATRSSHPEALYTEMARLAGALCTFSLTSDHRAIPPYDHDDLERCFGGLERHIREHLDVVLPAGCLSFPLEPYVSSSGKVLQHIRIGKVSDDRCFGSAEWVLAVHSERRASTIRAEVERNVKVAEARDVGSMIGASGVSGLPLTHLPSPPSELSPRVGSEYFRITREGKLWSSLQDSRVLGLYAPPELQDAEFELLVILDS
jgi:type VI secretion system protein ImpJ